MTRPHSLSLLVCALWISATAGCGPGSMRQNQPPTGACIGVPINGTLQDSLTNSAVAQGWVYIEQGKQLAGDGSYFFTVAQLAATDANGKFSLCAPALSSPSALVALALDSSARAYPPFVVSVSGAMNLTIPMGGCALLCGLDGQQQTSTPAAIRGSIATAPIASSGAVTALYSLSALDGSSSIWNLAVPSLSSSQTSTFTTATSTNCPGKAPYCTSYSFSLPSQRPIVPTKSGYTQQAGAPVYSIYASITGTLCTPPFASTVYEQDGTTPLAAAPGVQLSAAALNFSACSN